MNNDEVTRSQMSVRDNVLFQFKQVAEEQGKKLKPLTDSLRLLDSGLDSLCFAIIVVRLEDALGVDPFSLDGAEGAVFPLTVGEFVGFYETTANERSSHP